jgi:alpha-beta hydrolase superfamily lysophospholipase
LSACAPTVQRALVAPAAFDGPRFAPEGLISFDGAVLGLHRWLPAGAPWATIVALHGMNDYAEAFYLAGPYWSERGVAVYAYDARGFGRSPGRGFWAGADLLTGDLHAAVQAARAAHPEALLAVVGDSMGAATALAAFGTEAAPPADRLILAAPAVWGWSSLPATYSAALWLGAHTLPARAVRPPRAVQRRITPSDNLEMLRKIGRDPLMLFSTRIDAVYGLVGLMERAYRAAPLINRPTAVLYGARDDIIPKAAFAQTAARLPPWARTVYYPEGYHMLLRDLQAERVFADVLAFLRAPQEPFPSGTGAFSAVS